VRPQRLATRVVSTVFVSPRTETIKNDRLSADLTGTIRAKSVVDGLMACVYIIKLDTGIVRTRSTSVVYIATQLTGPVHGIQTNRKLLGLRDVPVDILITGADILNRSSPLLDHVGSTLGHRSVRTTHDRSITRHHVVPGSVRTCDLGGDKEVSIRPNRGMLLDITALAQVWVLQVAPTTPTGRNVCPTRKRSVPRPRTQMKSIIVSGSLGGDKEWSMTVGD
jgi:hypothetical protein